MKVGNGVERAEAAGIFMHGPPVAAPVRRVWQGRPGGFYPMLVRVSGFLATQKFSPPSAFKA